jgi:hypothetical protein
MRMGPHALLSMLCFLDLDDASGHSFLLIDDLSMLSAMQQKTAINTHRSPCPRFGQAAQI